MGSPGEAGLARYEKGRKMTDTWKSVMLRCKRITSVSWNLDKESSSRFGPHLNFELETISGSRPRVASA
jgi:hypothetical protein